MEKYTWFKNNIRSILALVWTLASIYLIGFAIMHRLSDNPVVMAVLNIDTFILGYYYSASKDKSNEVK
jgi:hypothetical protein